MRCRSSAVLLALAIAALAPSFGVAQYAPKWHVGDWCVIKTWHKSMSGEWVWDHMRYDIAGVEKVGNRECFVLETRFQGLTDSLSRTKIVHYVRTDDWLVVRQMLTCTYQGVLRSDKLERPLGLFGPFRGGESRLPRFPLKPGDNGDTTFRLTVRDDCAAMLREISGAADSQKVNRLLAEGDTAGERVMRPTGVVYQVREELKGNVGSDPLLGEEEITQSLQLWCDDQPWRLHEELVNYHGAARIRDVIERSWLVASGRRER